MIEGIIICKIITVAALCLTPFFLFAGIVSALYFERDKLAKAFFMITTILLGIVIIATGSAFIVYDLSQLQLLGCIGL